jgi:hypothetical protein
LRGGCCYLLMIDIIICIHMYIYALIHTYIYINMYTSVWRYIHTYGQVLVLFCWYLVGLRGGCCYLQMMVTFNIYQIYAYVNAYIHVYIHICICIHTYGHVLVLYWYLVGLRGVCCYLQMMVTFNIYQIYAYVNAYIHVYIHIYVHIFIYIHTYGHVLVLFCWYLVGSSQGFYCLKMVTIFNIYQIHAYMPIYIHICIYIYIYTYIYIYIYIYVYIHMDLSLCFVVDTLLAWGGIIAIYWWLI